MLDELHQAVNCFNLHFWRGIMVAKIFIKRKIPQNLQDELLPVLLQLRKKATAQEGYISGETLRNFEDPDDYLVISTWRSVDNWKNWFSSSERKELQEKIDEMLQAPTEYSIYLLG